jgi:cytochrome c biogenesis protein CcmG, thiol:disulfide interchange protein DsbE
VMRWTAKLLCLAAMALVGCGKMGGGGGGANSAGGTGDEHPLIGSAAPSFELPAATGSGKISLSDTSGKVAIIDFWATWCEPCQESFPHYEAMSRKFGSDFAIIGISEDDDKSKIPDFAKKTGATFPLAWDDGKAMSEAYNPPTMPTSYIVDKSGIVRFVHVGFHNGDEAAIEGNVQSLMK